MKAREKARPEAEKRARAIMKARETARPKAEEKARAILESRKKESAD
jgi:hypothetical protein